MEEFGKKIVRNTKFNIIGRFWGLSVALLMTPYIISHIGVERFGIWAIIGATTGYFGLLDFGIGTSFVKYISEFYVKKDFEKINQVVNTGLIFYSALAPILITLGFCLISPLLRILNIPPKLYSDALFVFMLAIISFAISSTLSVFGAIQDGLQRMDISNKIAIAISIPSVVGIIIFLEAGSGLRGLMINNVIILLISSIINITIAFRLLPELRFNPFSATFEMLKKLIRFGCKVQVSRVEDLVTFQADKLLLSHFLGIGLVTYYQLGSSIINHSRNLPILLSSAILPAASELEARKDKSRIFDLYVRGTKYLAIVGVPLLIFVFLTAHTIMQVWMGEGYSKSVLVIQVFAPCYLINLLTGMGTSIAVGMGKPELQMRASTLQLILNIILSIILILKMGFIGVVLATLISLSLSSIWFMIMFHHYLEYPLSYFARKVFYSPMIASLLPAVAIGAANHYLMSFFSGRLPNLVLLLIEAIFFTSIYALTIWRTSYLSENDKKVFATAGHSFAEGTKLARLARSKLASKIAAVSSSE